MGREGFITSGEVKEITFKDNEQLIEATLDDDVDRDNKKVSAHWIDGEQTDLVRMVRDQVEAGEIEESTSENPQPSFLGSLLASLIQLGLDRKISVVTAFDPRRPGGGFPASVCMSADMGRGCHRTTCDTAVAR